MQMTLLVVGSASASQAIALAHSPRCGSITPLGNPVAAGRLAAGDRPYGRYGTARRAGRPRSGNRGPSTAHGCRPERRGSGRHLLHRRGRSRLSRAAGVTGFQLLPRRWVVERTLPWLNRNRRLAKDFETSIARPQPGCISLPPSFSSGDWHTRSTTYAILIRTLRQSRLCGSPRRLDAECPAGPMRPSGSSGDAVETLR